LKIDERAFFLIDSLQYNNSGRFQTDFPEKDGRSLSGS